MAHQPFTPARAPAAHADDSHAAAEEAPPISERHLAARDAELDAQEGPARSSVAPVVLLVASANDAEAGTGISATLVDAYMKRPGFRAEILRILRWKVMAQERGDLFQDVVVRAKQAHHRPPAEAHLPGWFRTLTLRTVADYYETRTIQREAERAFAQREARPAEPAPGQGAERGMLGPWLERAVQDNPHDAETLAMLRCKAREGLTYEELAERYGVTQKAIKNRVAYFVRKYTPLRRKYRLAVGLALLTLLVSAVALAYAVYRVMFPMVPKIEILPDPPYQPAPTQTASAEPVFEPATGPPDRAPVKTPTSPEPEGAKMKEPRK